MTTESRGIPWTRVGVEATAIVASILLAFAIDAWWDARVERNRSIAMLNTIAVEFAEVERELDRQESKLLAMRQAVSDLLPHIGPIAPSQAVDSLYALIDYSFRATQIELPTSSLQALLLSGELSAVSSYDLKARLAAWPAQVSSLRYKSGMLEQNREEIIRYLNDKVPTLAIAQKTGQLSDYPDSSFTGDSEAIQRDMTLEGLFGNRGMMIEETLVVVDRLKAQAADCMKLITAELQD